jgi:polyhydroxyalkanoate synthesis regulator phasin
MPGMRLTMAQFGRLWNLNASQCEEVVQVLIGRGDLSEDDEGRIGCRCDVM